METTTAALIYLRNNGRPGELSLVSFRLVEHDCGLMLLCCVGDIPLLRFRTASGAATKCGEGMAPSQRYRTHREDSHGTPSSRCGECMTKDALG